METPIRSIETDGWAAGGVMDAGFGGSFQISAMKTIFRALIHCLM
jgi:hypothetical protein